MSGAISERIDRAKRRGDWGEVRRLRTSGEMLAELDEALSRLGKARRYSEMVKRAANSMAAPIDAVYEPRVRQLHADLHPEGGISTRSKRYRELRAQLRTEYNDWGAATRHIRKREQDLLLAIHNRYR